MASSLKQIPVVAASDDGATANGNVLLVCCVCSGMLQVPIQLKCLHHCCKHCLDALRKSNGSVPGLECPTCGYITDDFADVVNVFVAAWAQAAKASPLATACAFCSDTTCDYRCVDCGLLCSSCVAWHNKFQRQHTAVPIGDLDLTQSESSDMLGTSTVKCPSHGVKFEMYCFDCHIPKCGDCAIVCRCAKHTVCSLEDSRVIDRVEAASKRIVSDGRHLAEGLAAAAKKCDALPGSLAVSFEEEEAHLQKRKEQIMSALATAYDECLAALRCDHDARLAAASELSGKIALTAKRAGYSAVYGEALLNQSATDGGAALLHQRQPLLSWLGTLRSDLDRAQATVEGLARSCSEAECPGELDSTIMRWLCGLPPASTTATKVQGAADSDIRQCFVEALPRRCSPILRLGPAISQFVASTQCFSVALTADNRLLLAAGSYGMKEYDSTGRDLGEWKLHSGACEPPDQAVTSVSALEDGRVVLALPPAPYIMLLKRDPTGGRTWAEDGRIDVQPATAPPRQLSVYGLAVAVATGVAVGGQWRSGPNLGIVSLYCYPAFFFKRLSYDILSVVLTPCAVVTASLQRVVCDDGSGSHYVIDAFDYWGRQLWRCKCSATPTRAMCAPPSGAVIYAATCHGCKVAAFSIDDGRPLEELCFGSADCVSTAKLSGLSLNMRRRPALAVLDEDRITVTVLPVVGLS